MQLSESLNVVLSRKRGRSESGESASQDELIESTFMAEGDCGPRRTASDTLQPAGPATAGPFRRSSLPMAPATAGVDEHFVPPEPHMAKRVRHAREQAQQLRGCSKSQLVVIAQDLEAQEQQLREELREARRSYLLRVSDVAQRTLNLVRGSAVLPPRAESSCAPTATKAAPCIEESKAQTTQQQPSASFSFPRLQPRSVADADAATCTAALPSAAGGSPGLARRLSADGPATVMGPPLCVPPSRRRSGGGPMLPPHRAAEHSQQPQQQSQAWGQLAAAAQAPPLTRDGVLSSVMEMLRSKAAATAAASIPGLAPPASRAQSMPPPQPNPPHVARGSSAQRSPTMAPPPPPPLDWRGLPQPQQHTGGPSARLAANWPAPAPLTSSPPLPMSLLLPPQRQQAAVRASAPFMARQQQQ